jgi:hypothetical protein
MTLGGLVWFGGRLLQQACRTCPGIDSCDIYFTDDGARLLPWLGNPAVARDSLKTMFRQAAAPTAVLGDVGIAVARHPGEEVVRGLSASYSPDPGCPTAFLPLGERDCYLDGRPSPWHLNIVRPDALNDVSKVELPNGMPELRDFIEAFNIQAAKLEVAALSESLASRRCAQEFLKALVPVATERSPQPLFIEELDYVIRQLLAVNPERAAQPSDEAATTQEDAKAVWRFE